MAAKVKLQDSVFRAQKSVPDPCRMSDVVLCDVGSHVVTCSSGINVFSKYMNNADRM